MPSSNSGFPVIFSDVTWCLMLRIGTLLAEFGSQACFVLLIGHLRTRWYHPEIQIPCCSWWVKSSDKLAPETSVYHSVSTKWPRRLPVGVAVHLCKARVLQVTCTCTQTQSPSVVHVTSSGSWSHLSLQPTLGLGTVSCLLVTWTSCSYSTVCSSICLGDPLLSSKFFIL